MHESGAAAKREKATRMLSREHETILKVVGALERECEAIRRGKTLDREFFRKAIGFIRNYADKFHHAKEEDILFVELCKEGVHMHCNPVEQMLYEHDLGRKLVKGMEDGVEGSDAAKAAENGRQYADLLRSHIFKEDNILYPMADEALDAKTQEAIAKKFEEIGNRNLADEEKYLAVAEELEVKAG